MQRRQYNPIQRSLQVQINAKYCPAFLHKIFTNLCERGFWRFEGTLYCKNNYYKTEKDLKLHLAVEVLL